MTAYLTIPEITDDEPVQALTVEGGGKTFTVIIAVGDTAQRLQQAALQGTLIPLVVVATDAGIHALDNVYVTNVVFSTGEPPVLQLSFEAEAVRVV